MLATGSTVLKNHEGYSWRWATPEQDVATNERPAVIKGAYGVVNNGMSVDYADVAHMSDDRSG